MSFCRIVGNSGGGGCDGFGRLASWVAVRWAHLSPNSGCRDLSGLLLMSGGRGRVIHIGFLGLVTEQPVFQQGDCGVEGVAESDQEVDVIKVLTAAEAVGKVVLGVDGGLHLAAVRAEEAEVALTEFGWRGLVAEGGDCD